MGSSGVKERRATNLKVPRENDSCESNTGNGWVELVAHGCHNMLGQGKADLSFLSISKRLSSHNTINNSIL